MRKDYRDPKWIGQKFNRLTIIAFEIVPRTQYTMTKWIVRCDCGTLKSVAPNRVLDGNTKSCGCLKSEQTIAYNRQTKKKHGGRNERLYTIWHNMKQRCYGKTYKDYPNWGGRGIRVCDEWKDDYVAFRTWALENGYEQKLSLDRIDVNGDYSPANCRWADWRTQAINRTTSLNFEVNGQIKNLTELAEEYGIKYTTLYQRVHCYGWDIEKSLKTPIKHHNAKSYLTKMKNMI